MQKLESGLHISIIIPAYNEELRISKTLEQYLEYYNTHCYDSYEVLVILNGCKDNTEAVVKSFQKDHSSLKYFVFSDPIGKGGAIREGLKLAQGDLVGFTDADNSTRPEILYRLFNIVDLVPSIDCVIGSRRVTGSIVKNKARAREVFSWGFNTGVNILFGLGIRDTQCGAKIMRKDLVAKILPSFVISDMAFDINLLVDIKKIGGNILEIPIEWEDTEDSTIKKPIKTSVAMAFSVTRLRFLYSPFKFLIPVFEPVSKFILRLI